MRACVTVSGRTGRAALPERFYSLLMTSPQVLDPTRPISDRPIDRLVAEFLAAEFDADPPGATVLGVPGYDERLPELSDPAVNARHVIDEKRLRAFEALPDDELTGQERIDRDLVISELRGRAMMRNWAAHRRDPAAYVAAGLNGVFTLFLHRLRPDAELAAAATHRLAEVPRVLAEARANLDPGLASPLLVRRALAQARAGVMYCREEVPRLVPHPEGRSALGAAAVAAADAYARFSDYLADFEQRASGEFAIGEQRYTALLKRKEGLAYGAGELRERGHAALADLTAQLRHRTMALAGHDDWRGYVAELDSDAPPTPEDMLAGYRTWTKRARSFAYDRGLVERAARRPVRRRARRGIPARGARRRLLLRPPALRGRPGPGPLLRAVPARGGDAGPDPRAAGNQRQIDAGHGLRARGVPRPPLAPGLDGGAHRPPRAQGAVVVLLRGGVGALRRGDDARAGILRRATPKPSCGRWTCASSARRASSWTLPCISGR